jgi:hypothetical protein
VAQVVRQGLNSRSDHVMFVVDKVVLRKVFLCVPVFFCFAMSLSFHQYSTLFSIYMRLLPEGQMGEPWETSRKLCSFENRGTLNIKLLSHGRFWVRFHSSLSNLSNLGGIFERNERGQLGRFYRTSMHSSNNIWKLTENKI